MTVKPKAFVDLPNERYFNIVTDVVKECHAAKLIKWASNINEEHKRGLRLIKTVMDLKGQKRFKKKEGARAETAGDINMDSMTADDAKKIFRKFTTTTSYSKTFGSPPTAQADYNILKTKSLGELPIASILNQRTIAILDKWLKINDQDEYTGRIYFTVREMATVVKNQVSTATTARESFSAQKMFEKSEPARFDKIAIHH